MKFNSAEKNRVRQSDAVEMKNQGAHMIEYPANERQACYRKRRLPLTPTPLLEGEEHWFIDLAARFRVCSPPIGGLDGDETARCDDLLSNIIRGDDETLLRVVWDNLIRAWRNGSFE